MIINVNRFIKLVSQVSDMAHGPLVSNHPVGINVKTGSRCPLNENEKIETP